MSEPLQYKIMPMPGTHQTLQLTVTPLRSGIRAWSLYIDEPNKEVVENGNVNLPYMWLLPRKARNYE